MNTYNNYKLLIGKLSALLLLVMLSSSLWAQQPRTSYFMKSTTQRTALNPAFQPERGYVAIPILGGIGIDFSTNGLTLDKLIYPITDDQTVTFLDPSVDANTFLDELKDINRFDMNLNIDLLQAGWYAGKNFWTIGLSFKTAMASELPKSMFEFMKAGTGEDGAEYNISDLYMRTESYAEFALGYSRPFTEKLTLGAKVKFITGLGSATTQIDQMKIELNDETWLIHESTGSYDVSIGGASATFDPENPDYISELEMDGFSPSGFGASIDLGATYELTDHITLSASVLDLGFISWSKNSTVHGELSSEAFEFDGFDNIEFDDTGNSPSLSDQFSQLSKDLENVFKFKEGEASSRTTGLLTTIHLGGEYELLKNELSFGLLSSTRFYSNKTATELAISANYRPIHWFETALSYSFINSNFKTFGLALNFSPSWLNFFVGADYMPTNVSPQFVPISNVAANMYIGLSIPL